MQHSFSRKETKALCGVKEGTKLSQKDIAFIAYLYPKPCGGVIDLDGPKASPKSQKGRQDSPVARKSIPRIVTGLAPLFYRYDVHMSLHGEAIKADGTDFSYQYEEEIDRGLSSSHESHLPGD